MNNQPVKTRNRRLAMRRSAKGSSKVTCRKGILGLGPNLALGVLDVSETGARLVVKENLPPKEEVEVRLLPPGGYRDIICKGRIVWTVPTAGGEFCVGIQFDKRLDYATLLDLSRFPTS